MWKFFCSSLLSVLFLSSCTNFFIRQECDKLNWYQLGYDAALRGERISNDQQVNRCRRAEAEISDSQLDVGFKAGMSRYCQPETAYQTGKQGDTLNSDFCETNLIGLLKHKHADGIVAYCKDGLTAGQSGKKYKNVCSADLEKTFTPNYKKGRKTYLEGLMVVKRNQIASYDIKLNDLRGQQSMANFRLQQHQRATNYQDTVSPTYANIQSEISNIRNVIYNTESEKAQAQKIHDEYQAESLTLAP